MKELFYDIETLPVKVLLFRPGKQVVTHKQLIPRNQITKLISLAYCWNDGGPVQNIVFTPDNIHKKLAYFDSLIEKADVVIGKNSTRFDNKHMNTQRLVHDLPGMPDWIRYTDDLETQIRKYFAFPSYSLDYISSLLDLGGKVSMEWQDWVDVFIYREVQQIALHVSGDALNQICRALYSNSYSAIVKVGVKAINKFRIYGAKDVEDTRNIWNYCCSHFEPRITRAAEIKGKLACVHCGKDMLHKKDQRRSGLTLWQRYNCVNPDCEYTYAGRAPIGKNGKVGDLR